MVLLIFILNTSSHNTHHLRHHQTLYFIVVKSSSYLYVLTLLPTNVNQRHDHHQYERYNSGRKVHHLLLYINMFVRV